MPLNDKQIQSTYDAWRFEKMNPYQVSKFEKDVADGKMKLPPGAFSPAEIRNMYNARFSNKMSEEQAAAYDRDKDSGKIFVPPRNKDDIRVLEQSEIDAYKANALSTEAVEQLKSDLEKYYIKLPEGMEELGEPEFLASVMEMLSGEIRSTPESDSLRGLNDMPELSHGGATLLGTMATQPEETIKIIMANNPGVKLRYDAKGNPILKSSMDAKGNPTEDGEEFAIKPGFSEHDFARAIPVAMAFTPAGKLTTTVGQFFGALLTQTAFETSQKALGGDFGITEIAGAGVAGAGGHLLGKTIGFGKRAYQRFSSKVEPEKVIFKDMEELLHKAAKGNEPAIEQLAKEVAINPKIAQAATELGIDLPTGPMSTSKAYQKAYIAAREMTGSATDVAEKEARKQLAKKVVDLIEEARGLKGMNQMSTNLRSGMDDIKIKLNKASDDLYKKIDAIIEPKTPTPAKNLIGFLEKKADNLGGVKKLDTSLQKLLKELKPTKKGKQPTYAFLEEKRKELTRARIKIMEKGPFSNVDKKTILELEESLMNDQKTVIKFAGKLEQFEEAQKLVAMRKSLEDDMTFLFGRDLGKSMVGKLSKNMKALSKQDSEQFIELLSKIPKNMRQEVVASGLQSAFAKNAIGGGLNIPSFNRWFEGLVGNSKARNALFTNLPTGTRSQLIQFYRTSEAIEKVSKGLYKAKDLTAARNAIEGSDKLMSKIWHQISRIGVAAGIMKGLKATGFAPGMGIALTMASSLERGATKSIVIRAADDLISSPTFIQLAKDQSIGTAKTLARTFEWKRFFNALGSPKELSNPEQWLLSAYQAQRQMKED